MPHNPPMLQPESPEHQTLSVSDHRETNSQGAASDRASQKDENHKPEPEHDDSSEAFFSLYQELTEESDKERAERWQKDADGILVLTGLMAVAIVTLITVTIPDLKDDPQATSAFYLAQLVELQLNTSTPNRDKPHSSNRAIPITVNAFLFVSLSINLSTALLALLAQHWTHQYLVHTHSPRSSSCYRARVRKVFGTPSTSPITLAIRASLYLLFVSMISFILSISLYLLLLNKPVYVCYIRKITFFLSRLVQACTSLYKLVQAVTSLTS
ncbi:hypothetical protein BGW80DRAFT_1507679 [Lactifluus volemus]|nr:hypothetical protein BGW80DRAFT_1507679 [Lactifluus volemus]